jgi:hypothetical protein
MILFKNIYCIVMPYDCEQKGYPIQFSGQLFLKKKLYGSYESCQYFHLHDLQPFPFLHFLFYYSAFSFERICLSFSEFRFRILRIPVARIGFIALFRHTSPLTGNGGNFGFRQQV